MDDFSAPSAPEPPPVDLPPREPTVEDAARANRRRKRTDRSSLVIDPATRTDMTDGLAIMPLERT